MLRVEDFGTIFMLTSLLGALAISSPALAFVLPSQTRERFSELYVLGPNHMAEDYPFNVKTNKTYKIYIGINNHIGSSAYYELDIKLRNQTEQLPNSTISIPSPLPTIYKFQVLLIDNGNWETPLEFSLSGLSFSRNKCRVDWLTVNGVAFHVEKNSSWNSENKGFYLQLFFELWIYDLESSSFTFNNRFVGIWLNMTG